MQLLQCRCGQFCRKDMLEKDIWRFDVPRRYDASGFHSTNESRDLRGNSTKKWIMVCEQNQSQTAIRS